MGFELPEHYDLERRQRYRGRSRLRPITLSFLEAREWHPAYDERFSASPQRSGERQRSLALRV
jgi:hypothetical protein